MRIFALKSCDTCRKAILALKAAGHEPQVIDIRADGIDPADLARIITTFGDKAVNRASTTWQGLGDEERALPVHELLARHPTLMKRPVIDADGQWTIGWDMAVQARYGA
jgi:arsenate reductase-like glutaredoxin family protein